MAIREWGTLTWEEIRDLDSRRTVAILPVGAVEAHGPHLPLTTDCLIGLAMARSGAANLSRSGLDAVILPLLPYAAAPFAGSFPGTLSVSPATVTSMIVDLARELTRHELAVLAIASAHLDPAHLQSLSEAVRLIGEENLLPVVWPNLTRKPWATRLTEEFLSGACHAGRFEGSVVLATRPDLVRDEIRQNLAPNPQSLSTAIRDGAQTFDEAGGPRAYFGWPADATAEEGNSTIETLGEILSEAVQELLEKDSSS